MQHRGAELKGALEEWKRNPIIGRVHSMYDEYKKEGKG